VLSYLPLAHVFERAYIECASFVAAATSSSPRRSTPSCRPQARPPDALHLGAAAVAEVPAGRLRQDAAGKLDFLLSLPILGKIVAKKVLTGLGLDHVRLAGSGSAPIPAELIAWYRKLGLNLLEGYAMSEDFAYSHLSKTPHQKKRARLRRPARSPASRCASARRARCSSSRPGR
jgi:long-chain acyl-CoA synthetase